MNMKALAILSVALVAALAEGSGAGAVPAKDGANSASAISPQRKLKPWQRRRGTGGGLVFKDVPGPHLRLVNAQRRVPQADFDGFARELTTSVSLPWDAVGVAASADGQALARAALADGAAGVVVVFDSPDAPALLVAPEEGWAAVNVAKLAEGDPLPPVFAARFRKEVWRAAAWAVGGGNSSFQPCLLKGVSTMKDLDAIPLLRPGPEPNNKMIDEAHRRGVQSARFASYRQACQEGWAPAPTNDIQKTIFEQVKADKERGPTNPITIQPPKK